MDIKKRITELQDELARANGMHEDFRTKAAQLRDLTLRLAGAIQILGEVAQAEANGKATIPGIAVPSDPPAKEASADAT